MSKPADADPRQFLDTPLVAAACQLDRLAVIGGSRDWTWRDVHAAALTLSSRLGSNSTLCNLCNSRVGFLVTWLAAWRGRCVQLLPPSGGNADLSAILDSSTNPVVVVDDPRDLSRQWPAQTRCLLNVPEPASSGIPNAELAWSPDWHAPLVHLFTSGSTGAPESHTRTLAQLAQGAKVLGLRLEEEVDGGLAALRQLICSVPPQHMFGVEASVMLSLVHGMPALERRPLLPADVSAAFQRCAAGTAWIATPLHLRALVQSSEVVPHCGAVIASTMPLSQALAAQAETLASAPVLEIYGSTETGAVAMRRTARSAKWRPLPGVRVEPTENGTRVWGTHFLSPQVLADQTEPDGCGGFNLLGRQSDMIKIAGRRASLGSLNLLLQDLPGLADGVFHLPHSGAATERLVLIYSGAPLDRASTVAWLRERMDPVFLPRSLICVERLPRTDSGKLPQAALDAVVATWLASKSAQ